MNPAIEKGFSLVELMVGLTVGLFVLAGVGAVHVSSVRGSAETLAANRLNQEIRALVDIMNFDIRRAGFGYPNDPSMRIHNYDQNGDGDDEDEDDKNKCIVYLYAADPYDIAGSSRHSGFRLDDGMIQMKDGGTLKDCKSGTWEAITDPSMVTVTNLTFDASNSECFDRITSKKIACNDLASGVEARRIDISLSAHLTSDSTVTLQANESIRVRNDKVL